MDSGTQRSVLRYPPFFIGRIGPLTRSCRTTRRFPQSSAHLSRQAIEMQFGITFDLHQKAASLDHVIATPLRFAQDVPARPGVASVLPPELKSEIAIRDVVAGSEINPLWSSQIGSSAFEAALEASLRNLGLAAADTTAPGERRLG